MMGHLLSHKKGGSHHFGGAPGPPLPSIRRRWKSKKSAFTFFDEGKRKRGQHEPHLYIEEGGAGDSFPFFAMIKGGGEKEEILYFSQEGG